LFAIAGEWERLKKQYRTIKTPIKIGRKGANPSLVNQVWWHRSSSNSAAVCESVLMQCSSLRALIQQQQASSCYRSAHQLLRNTVLDVCAKHRYNM
jgi:hypothetical protein